RAHPEIEYAIGATRQAVLDHFIDTEGDQSMSQIKAALPNILPGTVEACVRREWEVGRLLRVSPGVYRLAPPEPAEPKPAPPPGRPEILSDEAWLAAMDEWFENRSSWDVLELGPFPNDPTNRIPQHVRVRFADRARKREERRKDREAAQARQAAADQELRDKLMGFPDTSGVAEGAAAGELSCVLVADAFPLAFDQCATMLGMTTARQ